MDFGLTLDKSRKDFAAVERLQRAIERSPEDKALRLNLQAARRRALRSEENLRYAASTVGVDILKYRIQSRGNKYSIFGLSESLAGFQRMVTSIFDAVSKEQPKAVARYSAGVKEATAFNFAYSYPGSLGIVLSVENERNMLFGELDRVITAIDDVFSVADADAALDMSRHLGLAAVNSIYEWVHANYRFENSIDLVWHRSDGIDKGQYISNEKFEKINNILISASDVETSTVNVRGILVGLDFEDSKFHIVERHGEDYRGSLDDDLIRAQTAVDKFYTAKLRKTIKRHVATGREEVRYFLQALDSDSDNE